MCSGFAVLWGAKKFTATDDISDEELGLETRLGWMIDSRLELLFTSIGD